MSYVHKTARKSWILWLYGSLVIGLFSIFITGGLSLAEGVECGDEITTYTVLTNDLNCSDHDGAALTLKEGAKLNLNGKKVIGNYENNCIDIRDDGTKVWNGTVTQCDNGIRVRSNHNLIISVEVSDSASRCIRIDGDENRLKNCLVSHSGRQGIKINGGSYNKVLSNLVFDNCRDGIEIDAGNYNRVLYNHVEDNGNIEACGKFGNPRDPEDDYYYKPWYYAGIDILPDSYKNKINHNRAGCNLGCVGSDDFPCTAHERDFWDENVDNSGNSYSSTNVWKNNRVVCKSAVPEYSPNPTIE